MIPVALLKLAFHISKYRKTLGFKIYEPRHRLEPPLWARAHGRKATLSRAGAAGSRWWPGIPLGIIMQIFLVYLFCASWSSVSAFDTNVKRLVHLQSLSLPYVGKTKSFCLCGKNGQADYMHGCHGHFTALAFCSHFCPTPASLACLQSCARFYVWPSYASHGERTVFIEDAQGSRYHFLFHCLMLLFLEIKVLSHCFVRSNCTDMYIMASWLR